MFYFFTYSKRVHRNIFTNSKVIKIFGIPNYLTIIILIFHNYLIHRFYLFPCSRITAFKGDLSGFLKHTFAVIRIPKYKRFYVV